MTYIGIDPGKSGALAIIDTDGDIAFAIPFDEDKYLRELCSINDRAVVACVEHVGAMPGQGVTSMFSFGTNFGFIQGILKAFRVPFELVRPQKWKKEFSISEKNDAILVCKRLFPDVSLLPTERCRKENDGMAEALLMAEYARRKLRPQGGTS